MADLAARRPWLLIVLATTWVALSALFGLDIQQRLTLNPGWEAPDSGSAKVASILRDEMQRDDVPVVVLFSPKTAGST